jgi:hypothetical protein
MKRIALLATLAMLIPAAVSAQPSGAGYDRPVSQPPASPSTYSPGGNETSWTPESYDDYGRSRWARDRGFRWVPLAQGYNAAIPRQFINIGGPGRFRTLRVEGVRGNPMIERLSIQFSDGTRGTVVFRSSLRQRAGQVINLPAGRRRIDQIIVYSNPRWRGSYSVYGA